MFFLILLVNFFIIKNKTLQCFNATFKIIKFPIYNLKKKDHPKAAQQMFSRS